MAIDVYACIIHDRNISKHLNVIVGSVAAEMNNVENIWLIFFQHLLILLLEVLLGIFL